MRSTFWMELRAYTSATSLTPMLCGTNWCRGLCARTNRPSRSSKSCRWRWANRLKSATRADRNRRKQRFIRQSRSKRAPARRKRPGLDERLGRFSVLGERWIAARAARCEGAEMCGSRSSTAHSRTLSSCFPQISNSCLWNRRAKT